MRILSVSDFFDTHGGGLERVAAQLSREFAAVGHHAIWAASDADGLPDNPAELIGLHCINPTEALTGLPMPLPDLGSIATLDRAVHGSDLIVIHDSLYVTSILAMIFAKLRRKPVVLIQHIGSIPFPSIIVRAVMRFANAVVTQPMMSAADRLVFISQAVRSELLGPRPRRASQLLFNGVNQTLFKWRDNYAREMTRQRWNLPNDATLVVFVGRFVEKKGLSVIKFLAERRPDIHFVLLGDGPVRPERWRLDNIHVMGQQPQTVVADLYCASDFLLLPSVGEGYPLVIQEAMACGLPVICGERSAQGDPAATKWLCGVSIDLSRPEESADKCDEALCNLTVSQADRAAMAEYAARTYRWETMANAILT
jgi:starch synthase